jgi:hypothetical protein
MLQTGAETGVLNFAHLPYQLCFGISHPDAVLKQRVMTGNGQIDVAVDAEDFPAVFLVYLG